MFNTEVFQVTDMHWGLRIGAQWERVFSGERLL
jgi:hypothetical protein